MLIQNSSEISVYNSSSWCIKNLGELRIQEWVDLSSANTARRLWTTSLTIWRPSTRDALCLQSSRDISRQAIHGITTSCAHVIRLACSVKGYFSSGNVHRISRRKIIFHAMQFKPRNKCYSQKKQTCNISGPDSIGGPAASRVMGDGDRRFRALDHAWGHALATSAVRIADRNRITFAHPTWRIVVRTKGNFIRSKSSFFKTQGNFVILREKSMSFSILEKIDFFLSTDRVLERSVEENEWYLL